MIAILLGLTLELGKPVDFAFSHNDYAHARPLQNALECGFTHVEADVFLVNGQLLVAHNLKDTRPDRTLKDLYLDPLFAIFKAQNGRIYPRWKGQFWLMIDIKQDGDQVYRTLEPLLDKYQSMLCRWTDKGRSRGAVAVVLSGERPTDSVAAERERWVAIDGRPENLKTHDPVGLFPWISTTFDDFHFNASEPTSQLREALKTFVDQVHRSHRRARVWGIPDNPAFWKLQREIGMDMINTDRLEEFRDWASKASTGR